MRGCPGALAAALVVLTTAAQAAGPDRQPFYLDLDTGGHRAFVKDMAFTPDGRFLVSGSDDKTIRIWDWQAGATLRTLRGEIGDGNDGKVFAVAVSPDGKTVAAGGYFGAGFGDKPPYGDVRLFDLSTGRQTARLPGNEYAVYAVAFSPDGQYLAAGGQDGFVYLWKADAAAPEGWSEDRRLDADSYHISRIAFAAGGTRIAAATTDNGIRLWDLATSDEIVLPDAAEALRDAAVNALAVSPDGNEIATGSEDGRVEIWNAGDGTLARSLPVQDYSIGALSFAAGDHLVVSCGYRCTDRYRTSVFRLDDDAPVAEFRAHDGIVLASAATPDGALVATTGGTRHEIRVWDPLTGEEKHLLQGLGRPVTAVGIEPRSQTIAWGTENPCPELDACPETLGRLASFLGLPSRDRYFEHPEKLAAAAADRFRRAVLSAGGTVLHAVQGGSENLVNGALEISQGGKVVATIENDATTGYLHGAFTLVERGRRLITGGNDGTLIEYEAATGKLLGEFTGGHTGEVLAVTPLEEQNLLLTGGADQTLRLWNLKTRELIVSIYFDDRDWVAWMPQGYYYASDNGDERFGWHVNQGPDKEGRFVRAGQLKAFLWSPEMVRRAIILRSAKAAVAEMRPGQQDELQRLLQRRPPEFDVRLAEDQSGVREGFVAIEVVGAEEAEADVADFSILANARNVGGASTRSVEGDGKRTIIEVPVEEGENEIRITGTNADGYLTERSVVALGRKKREQAKRGKLYAVVIGVEKYPLLPDGCGGKSCDLRYPVDDAVAFLDVLGKKSAPLFNGMESLVLVNRDSLEEQTQKPRLAALDDPLEPDSDTIVDELKDFLDQPGPDDTVIVFVAGHGVNIDEDYYFIPTDGRRDGERWKRSSLVEWSDIQRAVERAEGTRFLMLDTCHAANAFNPRLEKDAADARIIVFSATAANNTALELAELGHGVFTYTLLQGLSGAARSSDEGVTLFGLADYVGREVASLTASRQKPYYYVGGVENLLVAAP